MDSLQDRITTFLSQRGKIVDFGAARPSVEMEDQADDKGPYISKWDAAALGDAPNQSDGFSEHELHRIQS